MTGAELLSVSEQDAVCPHGSVVAKWQAALGPCTACAHEMLLKHAVCFAVGHQMTRERGYLTEQNDGETAFASRTVYECGRCGVLFT